MATAIQTATEQAPYVERFVLDGQSSRLSAAALETLAVVAYKQPVSRNQIASIRGVNVDGVMRTLQQRGYVDEVARDPGPGQAVLYGTTPTFLERLGLDSRRAIFRRSASSSPVPTSSRRSSEALRVVPDERGHRRRRRDADDATTRPQPGERRGGGAAATMPEPS